MGDVGEIASTLKPLVDNLAKLTGPMSEELGLFFGDKVRAFRQRNLVTIVDGSVKKLEDAGKPVHPVPPRLLLPIMEAASLEDNQSLQEMWSGLLASASEQADNMSPSYAETLKALTPIEARSLKVLYDYLNQTFASTLGSDEEVARTLALGVGLGIGESIAPKLVIETLERLGLIRREYDLDRNPVVTPDYPRYVNMIFPTRTWNSGDDFVSPVSSKTEALPKVIYDLAFTSYGIQFMRACQGPLPSETQTN
jgi:hypothetical protein